MLKEILERVIKQNEIFDNMKINMVKDKEIQKFIKKYIKNMNEYETQVFLMRGYILGELVKIIKGECPNAEVKYDDLGSQKSLSIKIISEEKSKAVDILINVSNDNVSGYYIYFDEVEVEGGKYSFETIKSFDNIELENDKDVFYKSPSSFLKGKLSDLVLKYCK